MEFDYRAFLHANARVMEMLETAKSHADTMIDRLPACLAVVDDTGVILRGNEELAKLLQLSMEATTNKNLLQLLDAESSAQLTAGLQVSMKEQKTVQLEIPLGVRDPSEKNIRPIYRWSLSPYSDQPELKLTSILATDVTALRQMERRSVILNDLPLGLLSLTPQGKVGEFYTVYTAKLLSSDFSHQELEGKTVKEVLFLEDRNLFTQEETDAIQKLWSLGQCDSKGFEDVARALPKMVHLPRPGAEAKDPGRSVRLHYQGVFANDLVTQVLVIILPVPLTFG
jgi:hypothetical protein